MKFSIVLVLSLAVLVSCQDGRKEGRSCCIGKIGDYLERIEKSLERNASLNANVIAGFRSNGLGQYIISENGVESINFTAVAVNYWTTLPKLANIAAQLSLPERVTNKLNHISNRINQIQTNTTELNRFVGVLYLTDNNNFVSGCTGQLAVDFAAVASDAEASQILACYIVADGKHNGAMRRGKGKGTVGRRGKGKGTVGRRGKGKGTVGRRGKGKGTVGRRGKGKGTVGRRGKGKDNYENVSEDENSEELSEEDNSEELSEEDNSEELSEEDNSEELSEEDDSEENLEEVEIIAENTM